MIEAYVTNLGKYVGGESCGEWLKFPATREEVQEVFAKIGVDGVLYEEFFITDYNNEISGLDLGEYESIDELNYLAEMLSELDDNELEKFEAAVEYGEYSGRVKDLINLSQNLDCYDYFPGISNEEDLGYCLIDDYGMLEIPDNLQYYFDYEAYGRDFSINEGGTFTDNGFITGSYGSFTEHYNGERSDIPEDSRVFAYPELEKMPIKKQLEMYGKMVSTQAAPSHTAPNRENR